MAGTRLTRQQASEEPGGFPRLSHRIACPCRTEHTTLPQQLLGGCAGLCGEFLNLDAKLEQRPRITASPTVDFPIGPQKLESGQLPQIESRRRNSLVELLGIPEQRLRAPIFSVRRTPNRDMQRFLFDDLRNTKHDHHGLPRQRAELVSRTCAV